MARLFRPGANSITLLSIVALFVTPAGGVTIVYLIWASPFATGQFETADEAMRPGSPATSPSGLPRSQS
jgi:hypothetical protein